MRREQGRSLQLRDGRRRRRDHRRSRRRARGSLPRRRPGGAGEPLDTGRDVRHPRPGAGARDRLRAGAVQRRDPPEGLRSRRRRHCHPRRDLAGLRRRGQRWDGCATGPRGRDAAAHCSAVRFRRNRARRCAHASDRRRAAHPVWGNGLLLVQPCGGRRADDWLATRPGSCRDLSDLRSRAGDGVGAERRISFRRRS